MSKFDIGSNVINTEVGFFPGFAYELFSADFDKNSLHTFNWIQAFWDPSLAIDGPPGIVVFNQFTHFKSFVPFAYSGERVNIKAQSIATSGLDIRGNAITSLPIDPDAPTTSLSHVYVYGGNY